MDKITIANECQHMEIVNKQYHIISKEFLIYFFVMISSISSLKRNITPVVLMQTLPLRRFDYKICLLIMAIFGVILSNAIERAYVIANKNKFHGL